ncbi:cytochrome P450 9e2 [Harpegnathos saltator]|uniref:Cytochrome P450 9e2 n=1 Tax=Harpegnathos saltator TaxID=610380 RepID=E2C4U7_HARSA|nr:cytochrome P450 9e2 [Harpegnathos saltator]EFN77005.1 Cytochrome P450 9e2 [Harpegnathos saltator]
MVYAIGLSLIAGACGLYYFFFKNLYLFKNYNIPYLRPWPLVGTMGQLIFGRTTLSEFVKMTYDKYPAAKYIGIYDFHKPLIMLRDPDLIKSIAIKYFDIFPGRRTSVEYDQDPLVSQNLFFLYGDKWRKIRAILSPSFTSSKMKTMSKLISDYAIDFTNFLVQLPPEKKMVEAQDIFARYTTDIIATCAYGISINSMRNPKNLFYMFTNDKTFVKKFSILNLTINRCFPWLARILKLRFVNEKIRNFFQDLVETSIKTRIQNNIVRPDMLQLMMESRDQKENSINLTIEDMASQAFAFFLAGFDTSSISMCFITHEIAGNENIQKKLQSEIDQVLEDTNGQVSYEAINDMEYLNAVLMESLRMYPPFVLIDRKCARDFELPPTLTNAKPFIVKKGQDVLIPIYGLHHDPKYFEEPEKFNPDRFVDEQKKHIDKTEAFLPFGLGPRKCIAYRFALMQAKLLLFHLLARCDLLPYEKTQIPLKFAKHNVILKTEDKLWLKVEPRKNPHRTVVVNIVSGTHDLEEHLHGFENLEDSCKWFDER